MSEQLSAEYIAGFFDGEGCVQIKNPRHGPGRVHLLSVSISNTYKPILEIIQRQYGGSLLPNRRIAKGLTGWDLYWSARKAEIFLRDVYPYLVVKKEQVLFAFKFLETVSLYRGPHDSVSTSVLAIREELVGKIKAEKRVDFPALVTKINVDALLEQLGTERRVV